MIETRADQPYWTDRVAAWVDRHRVWVWFGLIMMHALAFSPHWRVGADSALYMTIGRNLAEGAGYTYHGAAHDLVYPLLPWLISVVWQLTHVGDILTLNMLMLACHLGALFLIYRAMALHFDRGTGLIVTVLTAVAASVFPYAFQILSDPPFFLGVAAVLAGYAGWSRRSVGEARGPWLAPVAVHMALFFGGLVLALFARPTGLVILAAVGATVVWHVAVGPLRLRHVCAGGLGLLGAALFFAFDPRPGATDSWWLTVGQYAAHELAIFSEPGRLLERMIGEAWPRWFDAHATEALIGIELGPGLSWLMGAGVIALGLALFRWRFLWGALFVTTAAMLLVRPSVVRYFMPITPLLALAWWQAARGFERRWPRQSGRVMAMAMLTLWLGGNLGATVIDYTIEQRRITATLATYPEPELRRLSEVAAAIEAHTPKAAAILASRARVLTFKTGRRVIPATSPHVPTALAPPDYALMPHAGRSPLLAKDGPWRAGRPIATIRIEGDKPWRLCRVRPRSSRREEAMAQE